MTNGMDFFDEMFEQTVSVNASDAVDEKVEVKSSHPVWWRPHAMMRLVADMDDKTINLQFMLGEGKEPKENHYKKETKTNFVLNIEEAITFTKQLELAYYSLTKGTQFDTYKVVHQYNNDTKSLVIQRGQKTPDIVYVGLYKGADKYVLSFNKEQLFYLIFRFKLAIYEVVTGGRIGFTMGWF